MLCAGIMTVSCKVSIDSFIIVIFRLWRIRKLKIRDEPEKILRNLMMMMMLMRRNEESKKGVGW